MAQQNFTVSIPVSPYLHPFICKLYGNPIRIDSKTSIGTFLSAVLDKTFIDDKLPASDAKTRLSFFTESIICTAPISQIKSIGFSLKHFHIIAINRHFENLFEEQLYFHVKRLVNPNVRYAGYNAAIEDFANEYGLALNDTVNYDSLKKMEYRFRQKATQKKQEIFLRGLSPRAAASAQLF